MSWLKVERDAKVGPMFAPFPVLGVGQTGASSKRILPDPEGHHKGSKPAMCSSGRKKARFQVIEPGVSMTFKNRYMTPLF